MFIIGEVPISLALQEPATSGPEIGAALPQSFKAWLIAHNLPVSSGETGDADGDAVSNLYEYGFGTDPDDITSGPNELVYTGSVLGGGTLDQNGKPISVVEVTASGTVVRVLFVRRNPALSDDLTYLVQFTSNGTTWVTSSATPTVLASSGLYEVVAVPYQLFVGGKKTRSFRVLISFD